MSLKNTAGVVSTSSTFVHILTPSSAIGDRLDLFLSNQERSDLDLPRTQIQRLVQQGLITVDGKVMTKPSIKLKEGQAIAIQLPPPVPLNLVPEPIPLDILYEDESVIVINKGIGMVVHPGAGHATGTLVHALLYHCSDLAGIGGVERPGIVHRLDAGTSGVMICAKSDRAHLHLSKQFAERRTKKSYIAFVLGELPHLKGTLHTPYGRHKTHRVKYSSQIEGENRALTHYKILACRGNVSKLSLQIETGRTHQIRVHMADIHHPVLGDLLYGGQKWNRIKSKELRALAVQFKYQALHAEQLTIEHPNGHTMTFVAPFPPLLSQLDKLIT